MNFTFLPRFFPISVNMSRSRIESGFLITAASVITAITDAKTIAKASIFHSMDVSINLPTQLVESIERPSTANNP
jgi:hypothetical protein